MAKHKVFFFLVLALLLSASFTKAEARPTPQVPRESHEDEVVSQNCEGLGEEDCLMRRTLAAHVDYIYSRQSTKHK